MENGTVQRKDGEGWGLIRYLGDALDQDRSHGEEDIVLLRVLGQAFVLVGGMYNTDRVRYTRYNQVSRE